MDQSQRLKLHNILLELMKDEAPPHAPLGKVYFQAPSVDKMSYPCLLYNYDEVWQIRADNNLYHKVPRYQVTVIDEDPDSKIPGKILALPMCSFDRFYVADNLNHFVFNLYF